MMRWLVSRTAGTLGDKLGQQWMHAQVFGAYEILVAVPLSRFGDLIPDLFH
jgi:hypothetical protein